MDNKLNKLKRRILYFSSHRQGIGGGEIYLLEMAKELGSDFCVYFVEGGDNDTFAAQITELGYPIARLNYSLLSARPSAQQLIKICREWNVDLVHFNNRHDVPLAHNLGNVPKVMTIHTNFFASSLGMLSNLRSLIMLGILRLGRHSIQRYITVTQYSAAQLIKLLGVSDEQVHPIYNGVRVFPTMRNSLPMADRRLICSVTRLYRDKGVEYLIHALARLPELPWECQIVGDGPDRHRLEALVHRYCLESRVHFTGMLPRIQVLDILTRSRMMVLPSLYEGFPYSLLEAMSYKVPIITTRVLGLPEIVPEGQNGILVDPRDVASLANAIRTLLTDDDLAYSMGREGRRLVETRFSLTQMIEQTRQVYEELLKDL